MIPQSIYQADYHPWKWEPRQKVTTKLLVKPRERSNYRAIQMDLEIMQPFKPEVSVPFNLLHRNKEIVQENPHDPIPFVKLEDKMFDLKLRARLQRPHVYMLPQVSLDRVPVDVMYGDRDNPGLVSSIYSSDWKKACSFAIENSSLKPKSEQVAFEKKDIVNKSIEKTRPTSAAIVVPMEIGMIKYASDWENLNPVEFVDTTKLFWEKNYNKGLCSVCEPKPLDMCLTGDEKDELESCLKDDALRTPYTLHPSGYTGYVPRLALGIQFRNKELTKYDQFVTTLMEAQGTLKKHD